MEPEIAAPRRVATPHGPATVVAEASVPAAGRPDECLVLQRLETPSGDLIRLGYRRGDRMLRGPVSATAAELAALRIAAGPILAPGLV
jgi:hypothetical protein